MALAPHGDKLAAALANPKCTPDDRRILKRCQERYQQWTRDMEGVQRTGKVRVVALTKLLNQYKDDLEVEILAKSKSGFLTRQKGQLKIESSIIEEFLIALVDSRVLQGLPDFPLEIGPRTAFMSLAFTPANLNALAGRPQVEIKEKDTDFALGHSLHYRFSPDAGFAEPVTAEGAFLLAVLAAECKVNLDKTMFQEAAGTAARLKQGCPMARYYLLVEYLDMEPEDCRLTALDNVFLLRHAKRLPFGKRTDYGQVRALHQAHPIDPEIVWRFCQEVQAFVSAVWYDPDAALGRGSFV